MQNAGCRRPARGTPSPQKKQHKINKPQKARIVSNAYCTIIVNKEQTKQSCSASLWSQKASREVPEMWPISEHRYGDAAHANTNDISIAHSDNINQGHQTDETKTYSGSVTQVSLCPTTPKQCRMQDEDDPREAHSAGRKATENTLHRPPQQPGMHITPS